MKRTLTSSFTALLMFSAACSHLSPSPFSRGPASVKKQTLHANLLGSNDKGFRFQENAKLCINGKQKIGYNPGYFGECGDLSGINIKKLKKFDFTKINLKGAQLPNLDLSGIDFTGANLSFTNIRGSNFEGSTLKDTLLKGAGYDSNTKGLGLSDIQAAALGMIKDGYIPEATVNQPAPPKEVRSEYSDLLTTEDFDGIRSEFKTFAQPSERYHAKLFNLVKKADSIDVAHLGLILDVCYYQESDFVELKKNIESAKDYDTRSKLQVEMNEMVELLGFNNQILIEGFPKVNNLTLEDISFLSQKITSGRNLYQAKGIFLKGIEKEISFHSEEEIVSGIEIMNRLEASDEAAKLGMRLLKEFTSSSLEEIIKVNALLENHAKNSFLSAAIASLSSVTTAELHTLADNSYSNSSELRSQYIAKVRDLSEDNAISLVSKATYYSKDIILVYYLKNMVDKLTTVNLIKLASLGYEKEKLLSPFMEKVEDLSARGVVSFMALVTYYAKDDLARMYMGKFAKSISSDELLKLSAAAYEAKNDLMSENLRLVSDLSASNVIKMEQQATYYGKDTIVMKYMQTGALVSVDELIALSKSAYENKNEVVTQYWSRIPNIQTEHIEKIVKEAATYYAKDTIINAYIKSLTKITGAELISLSNVSYEKKSEILTNSLAKVSDWSTKTVMALMDTASYNAKDTIGLHYLKNVTPSITVADLIQISNKAYEYKQSLKLNHLPKISDFTLDNAIILSQAVTYYDKDIVVKAWLAKAKVLSTAELMKLYPYAYEFKIPMIMAHYARLSDLDYGNIQVVAKALTYYDKNTVIKTYLSRKPSLSTSQLMVIRSNAYDEYKNQLISENLGIINDITVSNALILAGNFTYYQKDTFLLNVIKHVNNLSKDGVIDLSNAGYEKKEEILRVGLSLIP